MQGTQVIWNKSVERQLDRVPETIARKFRMWVALVEESGIREVRKHKGFHDEPLKGKYEGRRSIRLNRAYRAIYFEAAGKEVECLEVLEINKHEY